ncbi:flagellar hook-basal body protein [Ornithinibacillus gellani]|uniref:flagellar hook-basal body protein n=1 Tax=Ornithinibacillus gellani TaxID=2293253 RepID=UPI000F48D95F|nr:flagellar hook-basal body protein [Ornithinibacillus gellani]TQS72184.1 flagellar hook-basal body protein [Ornithinibacillus gellani]
MLRGFYTAASGMIAQQRRQEALSNNIANAQTPGFKADQASLRAFPEMLLHEMGTKQSPLKNGTNMPVNRPVGPLNTGVYVHEILPDFSQGDIRQTGLPTDFALVDGAYPDETGKAFFTIQNAAGEIRYTRNGNFSVDGEGFLTTNQGYYVLNQAGNRIQTNGLSVDNGMVETAGLDLGIAYVAEPNSLAKEGEGIYAGEAENMPLQSSYQVKQGYLEQSNVDTMQTMTEMMNSYRMFETNQRVLKAYDESMGKAVNEIGRIG